jgi:hypothetical protein
MEKQHMGAKVSVFVESPRIIKPNFLVKSIWDVEHYRDGKLLDVTSDHNTCTAEGLNALLDIMFHGTTQITTWYVLLFESDTTPADGTTYATPVFTESTAYDEVTRPAYTEAAASGKSMTNSANKAVFTIDASKTIYGAALVGGGTDANTIDDQAGGGTMYCASKFGSSKVVVDNDVINVTITLTAADS